MSGSGSAWLAAVDLGASSGRVVVGHVSAGDLQMREVHRFRNGPVELPDGLYWDVLGLYQDVLIGLRAAVAECARQGARLTGIAIDSWACDYGLLDDRGAMIANPRHYRDPRTRSAVDRVHDRVRPDALYRVNGLQFLPFNTLYQLAAEPELAGRRALLVPDLLTYWLTGVQAAEETNASTTGLTNATTGRWDPGLVRSLGLPEGLLPPIVPAGHVVGTLTPAVRSAIGAGPETIVTTVGSHDTASAVVGVAAANNRFAYISCGTWGLVGVEVGEPVLTDASRAANFTNERGVDGTIRYLRNVMGLWLLSESLRWWQLAGLDVDLQEVLDGAGALPAGGPRFDPDDPVFFAPGNMPERIRDVCRAAAGPVPESAPEIVRSILDSLATAYATAVDQAEQLSGQVVEVVHIVGGGSQNDLLCRLVAGATGRLVVAGPVEATAIGNLLVQARTHAVVTGDLWDLRAAVRRTFPPTTYGPPSFISKEVR